MKYCLYERNGEIGTLTVNRPKALNALSSEVIAELDSVLTEIGQTDVRCLIVTGAGEKAFVAGADIAEMMNLDSKEALEFSNAGNAVMEKLESLPMPTIAAIGGFALGGGCELALACDIRIAADKTVFAFPETSLGILPGYGGIQRLARIIGASKAKELVFTCDRVSAEAALALGLVNAVVSPEDLMDAAVKMAGRISGNAPLAVRAAKRVANLSAGLILKDFARLESKEFAACFGTNDQRQAMGAFVEKRKPESFSGT